MKTEQKTECKCREVCVENDEYEREQQSLAKQIKRVVILRNDHILSFCTVQKCAHVLKLFQHNWDEPERAPH